MPFAEDDISEISDAVHKTADFVQWVLLGANKPRQLEDLGDKVQHMLGCGIMHYPMLVNAADLDFIVVPCKKDEVFN